MARKAFLGSVFNVFEPSWDAFWASWESLGSVLEPLGAILGRLRAKLERFCVTFGALHVSTIFWNDFGSKKDAQREAFWEAKQSKNQSKIELQI